MAAMLVTDCCGQDVKGRQGLGMGRRGLAKGRRGIIKGRRGIVKGRQGLARMLQVIRLQLEWSVIDIGVIKMSAHALLGFFAAAVIKKWMTENG